MTQMPFFIDGPCKDISYENTRDHPHGRMHKRYVEDLWCKFYHLADTHFRQDARNHFHQRFWEMYLAVTLLERGFEPRRHGDEGPEFYVTVGNSRIWFEAIAPGPGEGPDQVPQLAYDDEVREVPTEKILLRYTSALTEKHQRYAIALKKGIISPEDYYVLAINSKGIRHAPDSEPMPYFLQAFLAFGQFTAAIDPKTGQITDSGYRYRPAVLKKSGTSISTRAFLDQNASFCSAVLHSNVDCANHPDHLGGDFLILHNPNAHSALDHEVFEWCDQFIFRDNQLIRI